jgi:hypothetical protein
VGSLPAVALGSTALSASLGSLPSLLSEAFEEDLFSAALSSAPAELFASEDPAEAEAPEAALDPAAPSALDVPVEPLDPDVPAVLDVPVEPLDPDVPAVLVVLALPVLVVAAPADGDAPGEADEGAAAAAKPPP